MKTLTAIFIMMLLCGTVLADIKIPKDLLIEKSEWFTFNGKLSTINILKDQKDKIEGEDSMTVQFDIKDWAGIGTQFALPKNLKASDQIYLCFKGDGQNKARLELTDNQGERFEYILDVNFKEWQVIKFQISEMKRRTDWQPNDVPNDGLTLTEVEGFSIAPLNHGKGEWKIDAFGLISL